MMVKLCYMHWMGFVDSQYFYAPLKISISGESKNFSKGPHHVADPDIRLRGNLIFFSVCHVNSFIGGTKVYSQTRWGHAGTLFQLSSGGKFQKRKISPKNLDFVDFPEKFLYFPPWWTFLVIRSNLVSSFEISIIFLIEFFLSYNPAVLNLFSSATPW